MDQPSIFNSTPQTSTPILSPPPSQPMTSAPSPQPSTSFFNSTPQTSTPILSPPPSQPTTSLFNSAPSPQTSTPILSPPPSQPTFDSTPSQKSVGPLTVRKSVSNELLDFDFNPPPQPALSKRSSAIILTKKESSNPPELHKTMTMNSLPKVTHRFQNIPADKLPFFFFRKKNLKQFHQYVKKQRKSLLKTIIIVQSAVESLPQAFQMI